MSHVVMPDIAEMRKNTLRAVLRAHHTPALHLTPRRADPAAVGPSGAADRSSSTRSRRRRAT